MRAQTTIMEEEELLDHEHSDHHKHAIRKQIFVFILVFTLLLLTTTLVVLYGKGYRLGFKQGEPNLSKTGILQTKSIPTGAQIYIDDELKTATDNALNLTPGKYKVKISKDGYNDWQKDIEIKREVVSSFNALLLPKAPTLQSISTLGVESAKADPTGTKLAFRISTNSTKRNGIYVFDMTGFNFPVLAGQGNDTQLVDDTQGLFSEAEITWSPDGKQILASIVNAGGVQTYYLLKTDGFNETPQNITNNIKSVMDGWETLRVDKENARLRSLKSDVQKYARENFNIISWSPDENKILYQASNSAQMPIFKKPRLIGNNLLYERRDLEKDAIYVYDRKEDINTRIVALNSQLSTLNSQLTFSWFPDSEHIIYVHDRKIEIVEDDGANMTTIYAGPFLDHYVFPWPDGSKMVILTNLGNSNTSPTLYTIGLK